MSVATVSYGAAACAFLALGALLLFRWRDRRHAGPVGAATALALLWSLLLAVEGAQGAPWAAWNEPVELLRDAGWTVLLLHLLGYRPADLRWTTLRREPLLQASCALYLVGLALPLLGWSIGIGSLPMVLLRAGLAVLGLILVEQLYRNKSAQERWALKFVCIGVGGMFAYDFYLYSDTMLFRQLNGEIWAARGVLNALVVPLIGLSVRRSKSWDTGLAVSRRLLFHSAALFGSAAYLLAMSSAGYYLRYVGGSWGMLLQVGFLFGATALLAGILFSGSFRAWLRVWISKHFYRYNYDYRDEWMRFTGLLSQHGPGPSLGQRAIVAIAGLVESTGGALWLRHDSGLCLPVAHWQMPAEALAQPLETPFCQFLERKKWLVDLDQYARDPAVYEHVPLPAWLSDLARAWLVLPLLLEGRLFGFIVLLQPRSRVTLNWEVMDLLKIAASQAASYLAQQQAATALMLARQFESFNRMSTFVVHDLKNLVGQLSLLIPNAHKHGANPAFQQDMLETVTHSVQKMKLMLQKLNRTDAPERPLPLALDALLAQAVAQFGALAPRPRLEAGAGAGLQVLADRGRLERVLGHLVQNAVEATHRDGAVTVTLAPAGADGALVEIRDSGAGMSAEFIRDRLYTPFDSTKAAGMGIGAFESRDYILELGGRLDVTSAPGAGTTFSVWLPRHGAPATGATSLIDDTAPARHSVERA